MRRLQGWQKGQVDTEVNIVGIGLCGGGTKIVSVTLVGKAATVTSNDCNLVVIKAGDLGSTSTGAVTLVSDTGDIVTKDDAVTYQGAGNITKNSQNVPLHTFSRHTYSRLSIHSLDF